MPSPFPGMDPYLENPWLWRDVHGGLIRTCQELLNLQLGPNYVARVDERVYIGSDDDPDAHHYYPDLRVADLNGHGPAAKKPGKKAKGGVETPGPVVVTTITNEEVRESLIEIRGSGTGDVIVVIEVLSPTNKLAGSTGRESFLTKKHEVQESKSHWCEIDLLREGLRPAFANRLPPHEYVVHISPVDLRPKGRVWPIRLQEKLPTIEVPLGPDDRPVSLDLQTALDLAYDRAAYQRSIDYREPPVPPLSPALDKWAEKLLKKKKLR